MAYDNRRGRPAGRNNFGGRRFSRPAGDRPMFSAVCSECGQNCQVPFRPSGEKPVFCSDCFAKRRGEGERRPPQDNGQLQTINDKLDKILELLTPKPVAEKKKKPAA